ncbi:MAG TPA: response regulator [Dehalococcoidia bacterium]
MGRSILVVTDHPAFGRLLRVLLEYEGFAADVMLPGADALARARTDRPDLLLLDLGRPDSSVEEAAQALYEALPEVPVILLADPSRQRRLRRQFERAETVEGGDVVAVVAAVRRALGEGA